MTSIHLSDYANILERFEFIDETLVYVDAPLEGVVRDKTGGLFAFRCSAIVHGYLWHWVLLPVASSAASIEDTFEAARAAPPEAWISVVEDRRAGQPRVTVVLLDGRVHPIPIS